MRISTLTYFTSSLTGMQDNQAQINRLSQQIGANKSLLAARDDPLAAEKAMQLSARIAVREQYIANQDKALLALDYQNTYFSDMTTQLNDAHAALVQTTGEDAQSSRDEHAELIHNAYSQLMQLANSRDTEGHYVFAGFNTQLNSSNPPFQHSEQYPSTKTVPLPATMPESTAATYLGTPDGSLLSSAGVRSITIDDGHTVQVSDNLENVFKFSSPVNIPVYDVGNPPTNITNVATEDIFQALDQVAIALHDPTLPSEQVDTAITNAINAISGTLDRLGAVARRAAAAGVEVQSAQDASKGMQLLEENALTDLTQLDQAAAIIELQTRQTLLSAAQQSYAQTAKLTLFSYL